MPSELHLFDFDGTLFRSPDAPPGYEGSWGMDPQSLNPPNVPEFPSPGWWNQDVLQAARASIADPHSYAVLLTGRTDHLFRNRVLDLLGQQRLDFDQILCNPKMEKGSTASWKRDYLLRFLNQHPDVNHVVLWDDDAEKIPVYVKSLEEIGINPKVHHIDKTRRVARRWIGQITSGESLAREGKTAAGAAEDIDRNLRPFSQAYKDFVKAVNDGQARGLAGDHLIVRRAANHPWITLIQSGFKIAEGILSTRSIPPRKAKGLEMAYRLFANSRRMPKDVYKWWDKNKKRLDLILDAATNWPEKQEGSDELFRLGSFRVHNTVGATGAELESLKKTIQVAEKMIRNNSVPGFSRVLYGDIHVVSRITKAHSAAWYYPADDSIYLRRDKKTGKDEVQSLIHELGHRYWDKFAKTPQKQAWVKHHQEVEDNEVPMEDVHIPTVGESLPGTKVPGVKGDPIVVKDDGSNLYFEGRSRGKLTTYTIPKYKAYLFLQEQIKRNRNFPTPYSSKNAEEHFCEALKLMATGTLPEEHAIPFTAIWSGKS